MVVWFSSVGYGSLKIFYYVSHLGLQSKNVFYELVKILLKDSVALFHNVYQDAFGI